MDTSAYLSALGTYDVGAIVRAASEHYLSPTPNLATRENMLELVTELERFTATIPDDPVILNDRANWLSRLRGYRSAAEQADPGHSQELATYVAGPLLLGHYPASELQRTADLHTPFSLANQAKVSREFRAENLSRLFADLRIAAVQPLVKGIGTAIWIGIGVAIWWLFF